MKLILVVLFVWNVQRGVSRSNSHDVFEQLSFQDMDDKKTKFLNRMGMTGVPLSPDRSSVPSVMHRLYREMLSGSACTNKVYRVVPAKVVEPRSSAQFLEFIMPNPAQPVGALISAELRLQFDSTNYSGVNLTYEETGWSTGNATALRQVALQGVVIEASDREMIWNITQLARSSRTGYNGLRIELAAPQMGLQSAYVLITSGSDQKCEKKESIPKRDLNRKHRIVRREADGGSRKKRQQICRRKNLYVDFQEIGWDDWIISPAGFRAYYCDGRCPFPMTDHMNSTNHAIIQTMVSGSVRSRVSPACCVPSTLKPITMLYLDHSNQVVLREYADMVVDTCACR